MAILHPEAPVAPAPSRPALPLSITFGDYDRLHPLVDGRVRIPGIEPTYAFDDIAQFCERPVYEEFDVAEMSFSMYVMARDRGEPVIALPIFPLRMPVQANMFVRADSPYTKPQDLIGKKIGGIGYRYTVNLWLRGILQEHYGVRPQQMKWVSPLQNEGAGFVMPADIDITIRPGTDPEELLLSGEIDAVFAPETLPGIKSGDPRLRRLFPDVRAELIEYTAKTNIIPITHTMVVSESLLAREPWIADRLVAAFREAQRVCDDAYLQPKHLSLFDGVLTLEATRRDFGDKPYTHGLRANRHTVETFVRYAYEQGYTKKLLAVDDMFARIGND